MKITRTMIIAGAMTFLSASALAASANNVTNLANGSSVTLNGTVENFDSKHAFTLRDSSGTVKVDLSATSAVVLKNGETVTVTGTVSKGIIETDVVASNVSEDKAVGQKVGEAIDSVTGQTPEASATAVSIQSLPKSGLVKVSGTVSSVDSAKKFTLTDSTGHVDVNIKSSESASLNKGTQATVVGYVDDGILGKTINATKVDIGSQ